MHRVCLDLKNVCLLYVMAGLIHIMSIFMWFFTTNHDAHKYIDKQKETNGGFMSPLCIYRLNGPRKPPLDDEWMRWHYPPEQDLKYVPWWSEAEHATCWSQRLPTILIERRAETFCSFEIWRPEWGSNPRSPTFQAGSFNLSILSIVYCYIGISKYNALCATHTLPLGTGPAYSCTISTSVWSIQQCSHFGARN